MMRVLVALSFYVFLPLAAISFLANLAWLMVLSGWCEADRFLEKEHLKRN